MTWPLDKKAPMKQGTRAVGFEEILGMAVSWVGGKISTSAYAAEDPLPTVRRSEDPLPAVAPVLVANSPVPAELLAAIQRAWLAAPVDGLISPCSTDQEYQRLYASFLGAALGDASSPQAVSALWEHTRLQESVQGLEEHARRREHMDHVLTSALDGLAPCTSGSPERRAECVRRSLVEAFTANTSRVPGKCEPIKRLGFAVPAQAYYWQAIRHLREILDDPVVNPESPHFRHAAVCLREAFNTNGGRSPSCAKRTHGMWSGDYFPYIALAIIEAEKSASGSKVFR
jgi:hypothetical protein